MKRRQKFRQAATKGPMRGPHNKLPLGAGLRDPGPLQAEGLLSLVEPCTPLSSAVRVRAPASRFVFQRRSMTREPALQTLAGWVWATWDAWEKLEQTAGRPLPAAHEASGSREASLTQGVSGSSQSSCFCHTDSRPSSDNDFCLNFVKFKTLSLPRNQETLSDEEKKSVLSPSHA